MTPHHRPTIEDPMEDTDESAPRASSSSSRKMESVKNRPISSAYLVPISVGLGVLIAAATIVSGLGKAFYVSRDEYTTQTLQYTQDKTVIQQTLERVDKTLTRQEGAVQKVFEIVQDLKLDLAKHSIH